MDIEENTGVKEEQEEYDVEKENTPEIRKGRLTRQQMNFVCSVCGSRYWNSILYNQHVASHSSKDTHLDTSKIEPVIQRDSLRKPSSFTCEPCGKVFNTMKNLKAHIITHFSEKFTCPNCRRIFTSKDALKTHILIIHLGYTRSEVTGGKILYKRSPSNASECNEQSSFHCTEESNFKCPECSKCFKSQESLNEHKSKYHNAGKIFVCRICELYFANEDELDVHLVLHTKRSNDLQIGDEEEVGSKMDKCANCNKKFTTKDCLKRHIFQIHFGIPDDEIPGDKHNCEYCEEFIKSSDELEIQDISSQQYNERRANPEKTALTTNTIEENSKLTPSTIESTKNSQTVIKNLQNENDPDTLSSTNECYNCNDYGEDFKKPTDLENHKKLIYPVEKCEYCERIMPSKYSLKNHILVQHLGYSTSEVKNMKIFNQ